MIFNDKAYFINNSEKENVSSNFIYNRFDLYEPETTFKVGCIERDNTKIIFQVALEGNTAKLGIWLLPITTADLKLMAELVFSNFPQIKRIQYENSLAHFDSYREKNHFQIELPASKEELEARLSSKGRYNIRREYRLLAELGDLRIENYSKKDVPESVLEKYFELKKATHRIEYGMSGNEYIDKYHITDFYVMYLGERIVAMVLSCEQCPIVYIENLTYDLEFSKYSPGQVLYDKYLQNLIDKKYKTIYLAGGNLDYKKRYGSVEKTVYDGVIFRNTFYRIKELTPKKIKQFIKRMINHK